MLQLGGELQKRGIGVLAWPMGGISSVPLYRNLAAHEALKRQCHKVLFFDADQGCQPADLLALIESEHDCCALPVTKKTDEPEFNFVPETPITAEGPWVRVLRVGTGAMALSRVALLRLMYATGDTFTHMGEPVHRIFEDTIVRPALADDCSNWQMALSPFWSSEDYTVCDRLRGLDPPIYPWLYHSGVVAHHGDKFYVRRVTMEG